MDLFTAKTIKKKVVLAAYGKIYMQPKVVKTEVFDCV
jgi:hypothetical protein